MDGLEGFGPRVPKLPRNIQVRTQGWMRDHATRITAVTGLAPSPNPHVNITDQRGMTDALSDVAMAMLPTMPAAAQGRGEWFIKQAAKQMARMMSKDTLGLYVPEYQAGGKVPALYVVAENIESAAIEMGVQPEALAHYVTFHEATHQWQFTAHPWLNDFMKKSAQDLGDALNNIRPADLLRGALNGADIMSSIPGVADLQASMSLVEGYADFMTEQLGIAQDPDLATVATALAQRRQDKLQNGSSRSGVQDAVGKLTGLDAKRRQYAEGKAFCEAVHAAGGHQLLNQVWTSPATLPNAAEMARPQIWIARMTRGQQPGQAAA